MEPHILMQRVPMDPGTSNFWLDEQEGPVQIKV
jgi:hypothetical protein